MKVAGIDLAGVPKNPTGYCLMTVEGEEKTVETLLAHTDDEIIARLDEDKPYLTGVDAPLVYEGRNRNCDKMLVEYGALPATLPGMTYLAERGTALAKRLDERFNLVEVNVRASSKILGVQNKDEFTFQKNIMGLDLDGDITRKLLCRDELDAIVAAITAYLHTQGRTKTVGAGDGQIVIPEV